MIEIRIYDRDKKRLVIKRKSTLVLIIYALCNSTAYAPDPL